jgi:hypothetical protein
MLLGPLVDLAVVEAGLVSPLVALVRRVKETTVVRAAVARAVAAAGKAQRVRTRVLTEPTWVATAGMAPRVTA